MKDYKSKFRVPFFVVLIIFVILLIIDYFFQTELINTIFAFDIILTVVLLPLFRFLQKKDVYKEFNRRFNALGQIEGMKLEDFIAKLGVGEPYESEENISVWRIICRYRIALGVEYDADKVITAYDIEKKTNLLILRILDFILDFIF